MKREGIGHERARREYGGSGKKEEYEQKENADDDMIEEVEIK
jgi:hypothetical protein